MDQEIQFCTTSDGVQLAYATLGEGPPLVYVNGWPGHLAMEWELSFSKEFLQALSRGVTLIRYDMRGSGLSDREVDDVSLETLVKDLEAVVDHLKLERFPLLSFGFLAGPIAISYAVEHPDRVSRLVISSGYLRGAEITSPDRQKAMVEYVKSFGIPDTLGSDEASDVDSWLDVFRIRKLSAKREFQAELLQTMFSIDVTDLAARVTVPALVMHGQTDGVMPFRVGRALAAGLPQARFAPFKASSAAPWQQREFLLSEARDFLDIVVEPEPEPASVRSAAAAGVPVTILFTDMEGSTMLTQRLGDAKAQEVVRAHNEIVRTGLSASGGSEIKHTGDGIMASFASASGGLECAVAIQQAIAAYAREQPDAGLSVRIGLNAGEPVAEDEDLFGTAVQVARRICDSAAGGEIFASNVVRELAAGKGFLFSDRGETVLRGFEEPVRLYEVRWRDEG